MRCQSPWVRVTSGLVATRAHEFRSLGGLGSPTHHCHRMTLSGVSFRVCMATVTRAWMEIPAACISSLACFCLHRGAFRWGHPHEDLRALVMERLGGDAAAVKPHVMKVYAMSPRGAHLVLSKVASFLYFDAMLHSFTRVTPDVGCAPPLMCRRSIRTSYSGPATAQPITPPNDSRSLCATVYV